jgi:hypothetical protein
MYILKICVARGFKDIPIALCQFALDKTLDSSLGTPNLRDLQPSRSHQLGLDIIMMADFASTERTEAHWHQLVGSAGLKITKIF